MLTLVEVVVVVVVVSSDAASHVSSTEAVESCASVVFTYTNATIWEYKFSIVASDGRPQTLLYQMHYKYVIKILTSKWQFVILKM